MTKAAILGSGAWGTALACIAARSGHDSTIWGRSADRVEELNVSRTNSAYLGDLKIADGIAAVSSLEQALEGADFVFLCVPTQQLSGLLAKAGQALEKPVLIACCKGIDRATGQLPADLILDHLPNAKIAALSGPSFASDVVQNLPTAVTIASRDAALADELVAAFSTNSFRCYASTDIKGVELGGALKNVLALAVGAVRGMGLGASAEAALIARGFAEVNRIAVALGAEPETLAGLSGLGDLVLTCSSTQSRNFTYGMAMGRAEPLEGLPLAEGAHTAAIAHKIAQEHQVQAPIIEAVVNVLEKRVTAREAVSQLLTRPLKREI